MNRSLAAWLAALALAVGVLLPFVTCSARVMVVPIGGFYAPLGPVNLPAWSVVLLGAAFTYHLVPVDAWPLDLGDPGVAAPVQSSQ